MKRIFLVLVVLVSLVSCSDSSDQIIGKWKLESIDYSPYFKKAPEDLKSLLESRMQEEFNRLKDKTFFTFSEDLTLRLEAPNFVGKQIESKGTFSFNSTKDSLFLQLIDKESYKIDKLDEESMILSTSETPDRILTLSKMK